MAEDAAYLDRWTGTITFAFDESTTFNGASLLWYVKLVATANENDIDGLVQERRNSSALAMELHLSCTNPSI